MESGGKYQYQVPGKRLGRLSLHEATIGSPTWKWGNVALQDIPFVDTKLPYHQCIPSPSILLKYGLSEETFPVVSGDRRREDMIFGVNVMRKLQILQNCEWKDSEPSKSLIGFRPIGSIFWGLKLDERENHYVCAIHSTLKRNYVLSKSWILCQRNTIYQQKNATSTCPRSCTTSLTTSSVARGGARAPTLA